MKPKIVYCSFDRFPSPKGAATHIEAFVTALGKEFDEVDLVTLPSGFDKKHGAEFEKCSWHSPGVSHFQLEANGSNLIDRVSRFRRNLDRWWAKRFAGNQPQIVHFRSIFEGYPIARNKEYCCNAIVFEVNGLPSIELKYHYPHVAEDNELLTKIKHQEEVCIRNADLLITVSDVNKKHLENRGADPDRIKVIPNGVDLDTFHFRSRINDSYSGSQTLEAVYTGTMSSWQGVLHAIDSIALYRRDADAKLLLVGPYRKKEADAIQRRIDANSLRSVVELKPAVNKIELCNIYHCNQVLIAPLTSCDRNTTQGCCPLKVIEAMAAGIPVVASRLPVIEELVAHDVDGLLVKPNSAKSIKDALFRLRKEPGLASRLANHARLKAEKHFSWQRATRELIESYQRLL